MRLFTILTIVSLTVSVSCSKSDETLKGETSQGTVVFTANMPTKHDDWGRASRGVVTDNNNIADFGAFCFHTLRTPWSEASATATPNKMFDVNVTRTGISQWSYDPPVKWGGGDGSYFTFFGYSPRAAGMYAEPENPYGNNIELASDASTPGIPKINYTTLSNVPSQVDFLLAKPIYNTRQVEKVQMQFVHALSQIRFKGWAAKQGVTPLSISINGIKFSGTIEAEGGNIVWAAEENTQNFVLSDNFPSVSTNEALMTDLSAGGRSFMLMPQDLTANETATIVITAQVEGETKTKIHTIKENWLPGKTYTYTVSLGGNPTAEIVITDVTITDWQVDDEENMATTPKQWVDINGCKWAVGNLVANGENNCKIGAPTDYGLYFQFGSLIGWAGGNVTNGDGTGQGEPALAVKVQPSSYTEGGAWSESYYKLYNASNNGSNMPVEDAPTTGVGDPCRYYLGAKWRTATKTEYDALIATGADMVSDGFWFANKSLFLSNAGLRYDSNGSVGSATYSASLWSSSASEATTGSSFYFSGGGTSEASTSRAYGYPVRCVIPPPKPFVGIDYTAEPANTYVAYPATAGGAMQGVKFNALKKPVARYTKSTTNPTNLVGHNPSTASADAALSDNITYQSGDIIEVTWQTAVDHGTTGGATNMVIESISLDADGIATVKVRGAGNALLSYKRGTTTLWNYHIWATDSNPYVTHHNTGSNVNGSTASGVQAKFMDRNLGALSTTSTQPTTDEAYKYFGMMYQHGRPTPFTGQGLGTVVNTYTKIFNGSGAEITSDIGGYTKGTTAVTTVTAAIQNPATFYAQSFGGNYSWFSVDISTWSDYSANSKSIYDPCPYGYRVPFNGSWKGFTVSHTGAAGTINLGSTWNGTWWSIAGSRQYMNGNFDFVGNNSNYWLSTQHSSAYQSYCTCLDYKNTTFTTYDSRSYGFPVRCVQEGY